VDRDAAAGLAGLAEDALPRDAVGAARGLHGGAGDARAAGDAGELGDLAVGRDAAGGDAAHDAVDLAVQAADVLGFAGRHRGPHATTGP
jgi:hypothetical protein